MKQILCIIWLLIIIILCVATIFSTVLCKHLLVLLSYGVVLTLICFTTVFCINEVDNWLNK